ncbi:hypothetical protein HID58_074276 [Brassica napus]|uniref:Uncharacterized protein n=1 Tax=Brassica napus TaxID=3708 RepID=A0ABQ7YHN5_BRANA|nr:hypothetical protein HID58_074276 [Brassica napus]
MQIWDTTIYKKQKMNPQTSIALREDVIQRTVYVSDIDQQVTEEQLDCLFIGFGQAEDEHEMRARNIYYTKIDTKVTQTDIKLLFEAACGEGENVVWLFLGVANTSIILHDDEFLKYLKDHQENFRFERM